MKASLLIFQDSSLCPNLTDAPIPWFLVLGRNRQERGQLRLLQIPDSFSNFNLALVRNIIIIYEKLLK